MAKEEKPPDARASDPKGGSARGRDQIARVVVVGSFLTLFAMVAILIAQAQSQLNEEAAGVAEQAFNVILPVLAGWVGTVLAFYFSSAAQDQTNQILKDTINRVGVGPGTGVLVSEKMIPWPKVKYARDLKDTPPAEIPLATLKQEFDQKLPSGGKVTRLLFVEDSVFKYVLHIGAFNAFMVKVHDGETESISNFADLLADSETMNQISSLVAFVSPAATLGDAKAALDKVNGAQDVIVTSTGKAGDPVLGWLSNIDLTKALTGA